MVASKSVAQWIEVDPASLPLEIAKLHKAYKDIYAQMKAARVAFETAMNDAAELPAGKRMVFGYNFGKLSVAVVDDDRKAKPSAKAKVSLADYLREMQGRSI